MTTTDRELEDALLGGIIVRNAHARLRGSVTAATFTAPMNRRVFEHIENLALAGLNATSEQHLESLAEAMRFDCRRADYLVDLMEAFEAHADEFATLEDLVTEIARRRAPGGAP